MKTPETLRAIAHASVAAERATGCPADVIAAQCIIESGWLNHAPHNNCFGIKEYAGQYGRQLLATHEWFTTSELAAFLQKGGERSATPATPRQHNGMRMLYDVHDYFATFGSLADCFKKRAAMWDKGPYAPAAQAYHQNRMVAGYVKLIAPIYATDPMYEDTVMALIHMPDLQAAIAEARG